MNWMKTNKIDIDKSKIQAVKFQQEQQNNNEQEFKNKITIT